MCYKNKLISSLEENTQYHLSLGSVEISGVHSVIITSFELIPKIDKEAFNRQNRYRKDWIALKVNGISFEGIRWKDIFFNQKLNIDKLSFKGPDIETLH